MCWGAWIAFSRVYLGAHWLSDVLGGLSLGVAWLALLGIAYLQRPTPSIAARGLLVVATILVRRPSPSHGIAAAAAGSRWLL
ncbi:MAG: phosphatase PAP2 family protein [Gammaproteobacteria bacterium]|nr:phosphatase PAP2 family protein [Gammaproteobacteria bacterium]